MKKTNTLPFEMAIDIPSRHLHEAILTVRRIRGSSLLVLDKEFRRVVGRRKIRFEAGTVLVPDWRVPEGSRPTYKVYVGLNPARRGITHAVEDAMETWRLQLTAAGQFLLRIKEVSSERRARILEKSSELASEGGKMIASLSAWQAALAIEKEAADAHLRILREAVALYKDETASEDILREICGQAAGFFRCNPYRDLASAIGSGASVSELKAQVISLHVASLAEEANGFLSRADSFMARRRFKSSDKIRALLFSARAASVNLERYFPVSEDIAKATAVRERIEKATEAFGAEQMAQAHALIKEARKMLTPFLAD